MGGTPRLLLREPFDERTAWEISRKGWYSGAIVELPDGLHHPVVFYDPVRLTQDLQAEVAAGHPCLAEPAMIVVPEITEAAMQMAAEYLYQQGWFERSRPVHDTA